MARIAKITVADNGQVTVSFTVLSEMPTAPLTLPEQAQSFVVPQETALDMIRQWLSTQTPQA